MRPHGLRFWSKILPQPDRPRPHPAYRGCQTPSCPENPRESRDSRLVHPACRGRQTPSCPENPRESPDSRLIPPRALVDLGGVPWASTERIAPRGSGRSTAGTETWMTRKTGQGEGVGGLGWGREGRQRRETMNSEWGLPKLPSSCPGLAPLIADERGRSLKVDGIE